MPRTNLASVASRVAARARLEQELMERVVLTAATVTAETVVADTPVQTAEARSNWIGSLGVPSSEVRAPYFPFPPVTDPDKKQETANRSAALAQIIGAWRTYRIGRRVFLANNVDYIVRLNAGASLQTRPGFLERASARGRAIARRLL